MVDISDAFSLRARYVFPVVGPPIECGIISIRGDRIESVGKTSASEPLFDLGNVAILPGLVNAHTHLEFSNLEGPLGERGESLPAWIRRVIHYRQSQQASEFPIQQGVKECLSAGVTSVGEISTSCPAKHALSATSTAFHEIICLNENRFEQTLQELLHRIQSNTQCANGISPHAPYSVHPRLLPRVIAIAVEQGLPVAMHLAESPEEIELLRGGRGPFREMLEELGVWRDDANPAGRRSLDYLRCLAEAPRSLVVHGNYLDDEEINFLAEHRDRMAVAYCPRTHAFVAHSPYPLTKMLARGVTMCLGTDSRASNPDLNLLEEMKFVAHHHADASPQQILRMATLNGARTLAGNEEFGKLTPGAHADLVVVALPDARADDPHELLFADEAHVVQTWLGGRKVF